MAESSATEPVTGTPAIRIRGIALSSGSNAIINLGALTGILQGAITPARIKLKQFVNQSRLRPFSRNRLF